jgi:uncharacterized protein (TIGR00369 family)
VSASRTGLEVLVDLQERGPGAVGVGGLLDMRLAAVEPGRVAFTVTTRPAFSNPQGTLHGGITATLLDSAMACAVLSQLPSGAGSTTVDLSVTYLRPVSTDGCALRAEGAVVHLGRTIATARGEVRDERDRLIATAVTTCVLSPPEPPRPTTDQRPEERAA